MESFFNRLKAQWYRRGLDYSTLPRIATELILSRTPESKTFLDVGSGCGTLSLPLARAGRKVTAIDPSKWMIEILKEDIQKEGIKGITPVLGSWGEAKGELKPHDAVICANVPALLKEPELFLKDAEGYAKRAVFLIVNADPKADKFYYNELYPLLFGKPFGERSDYLDTYSALHDMGVYANIEMIEYDFDQPFDNIEEAVEFWKEYIGIVTEEHDRRLKEFLSGRLVKKGKLLLARFHKRSAVIWWRVSKKKVNR